MLLRRTVLRLGALLALGLCSSAPNLAAAAAESPSPATIVFTRFDSAAGFGLGTSRGIRVEGDSLVLEGIALTGTWTSPEVDPGFAFSQLVSSWNANTPGASSLKIDVQPTVNGHATRWLSFGEWAEDDTWIQRTSARGQEDADARVDTDTLVATGDPFERYQLRVTLNRAAAAEPSPTLRLVGAVVSTGGERFSGEPSLPGPLNVPTLSVPEYSQEIHAGHNPQWGSGGARWCSPTSTAMVVASWGKAPTADDLSWVARDYADPDVEYTARNTFDAAFNGTGNWSFNVAYAGRFGLDAFVTQLRSLSEAESFIRAGIPVVASLKPGVYGMDGYLFPGSVEGHLLVIIGFDAAGNPIVNDPAAWSDAGVPKVYDRAQFERSWLGGSGGIAYIIRPPTVPLPLNAFGATRNW
jgi:Peptidase_C39 like family